MRLSLSRPPVDESDLLRVLVRPILLKGLPQLNFTWRHRTRDETRNLPVGPALAEIDRLLGTDFRSATFQTVSQEVELGFSKRGRPLIRRAARRPAAPAATDPEQAATHNREKHRQIPLDRPYLAALGVTDGQGRLIPAMARKWRQINKFIEVFVGAWRASALAGAGDGADGADGADGTGTGRPLTVVDFGAGKGYLTFALYDLLVERLGLTVSMTGVERRADLVDFCNRAAADLGFGGLVFRQGDIDGFASREPAGTAAPVDVMIALHACDTATDDALHQGVRAGASILICSPCCHKELRPQLLSPHPLRPILRHGIHQTQQAEMLTDGLRALVLQAHGYDAQVFEFVALEHTRKNKMILATRRDANRPQSPWQVVAGTVADAESAMTVRRQIDELMAFYGIRSQRLYSLLCPP